VRAASLPGRPTESSVELVFVFMAATYQAPTPDQAPDAECGQVPVTEPTRPSIKGSSEIALVRTWWLVEELFVG
ncbi:MAG TPA: hypothetical protein VL330_12560, partial [Actinomycetes bacterium]|nr:hypothetical protein [Actinomycetes bacterium]